MLLGISNFYNFVLFTGRRHFQNGAGDVTLRSPLVGVGTKTIEENCFDKEYNGINRRNEAHS